MAPGNAASTAMGRLEPFIGEWVMEADLPSGPAAGTGRAIFEWALEGQFLIGRTVVPGAPDSIAIVGLDSAGQSYIQHYFDSRGVTRVYAMDLTDGVWTLLRDSPDFTPLEFSQRFTGTFSADGRRIDGRWESAQHGSAWELDFHLSYVKAG
jgi:hypothetical protein